MLEFLKSKRIAVVGMGVNNRKLADFLSSHKIKFDVIKDWKSQDDLIEQLINYEILFRTPGLPYKSLPIQNALSHGVLVTSQTELFLKICPCPVIGVTGTKGKGTTSSLIAKILSAIDIETPGRKIWLAGNIGRDPFEFIDKVSKDHFVVLELSSFQIEDLSISPHISVILNITSDHLNYHETFNEYVAAKLPIIKFQKKDDFAILHSNLPENFKHEGLGQKIFIDAKKVATWPRKLLGVHNLENIAAAVAVGELLNISEQKIKEIVADFEPLPHRLNIIKEINGILFVDDSFSTNIDPTLAAINSFDNSVVLCVGGSDKGLDFTVFGETIIALEKKVKALVVFGQVTDKILLALKNYQGKIFTGAKNMQEIITQAKAIAKTGDVILFSPATASFDMFKNEVDRGEQFVNIVNALE